VLTASGAYAYDHSNGEDQRHIVEWFLGMAFGQMEIGIFIVTTLWTYQLNGTQCAHLFMRRAALVIKSSREAVPA